MKKTNFFLLFLIASISGVCLPNEIFASDGMGFFFRGTLLFIGLLMYTIALCQHTKNLMDTELDGFNLVHIIRFITVAMMIGIFFYFVAIGGRDDEIKAGGKDFYYFVFYTSISLVTLTLFLIFINNDIKGKKTE